MSVAVFDPQQSTLQHGKTGNSMPPGEESSPRRPSSVALQADVSQGDGRLTVLGLPDDLNAIVVESTSLAPCLNTA